MKIVSVALREGVEDPDRDALRQALTAERGIVSVSFDGSDHHRLVIEYDPSALNETQLLDSIYRHGLYPEPVPQTRDLSGMFRRR